MTAVHQGRYRGMLDLWHETIEIADCQIGDWVLVRKVQKRRWWRGPRGEFTVYTCVEGGTPGRWRKGA